MMNLSFIHTFSKKYYSMLFCVKLNIIKNYIHLNWNLLIHHYSINLLQKFIKDKKIEWIRKSFYFQVWFHSKFSTKEKIFLFSFYIKFHSYFKIHSEKRYFEFSLWHRRIEWLHSISCGIEKVSINDMISQLILSLYIANLLVSFIFFLVSIFFSLIDFSCSNYRISMMISISYWSIPMNLVILWSLQIDIPPSKRSPHFSHFLVHSSENMALFFFFFGIFESLKR